MNHGKYIFAQSTDFLPKRVFDGIVKKYGGNRYVRHFTCWNQLLCMMFGQLSNRDSLRDLVTCLGAHGQKSYHLGLGRGVTRSNLAKANENRDHRIFGDFAYCLIAMANRSESGPQGKVYAFDSSTIDLCLSVFWWAGFRKAKGGIKLHTLLDVETLIRVFVHITPANVHDVNAMDLLVYERGAWYIFDRAYLDYARLNRIGQCSAYFVIRAKSNIRFARMYSAKADRATGVLCDQIGRLTGKESSKAYPGKLRRIKYRDGETGRTFVFLTNNMEASALDIAMLYKQRWQVELFFKWIKQHLKIKSFWGTSENAVRIQIYSAIITYCMVVIMEEKMKLQRSTYETLQVLGISLLDKTPVNQLFNDVDYNNDKERDCNQLKISLF